MYLPVMRREKEEIRFPIKTPGFSVAILILADLVSVCAGCRSAQPDTLRSSGIERPAPVTDVSVPAAPEETTAPLVLPSSQEEPDRWLVVEKATEGSPGAWATGSFDAKRNKLIIQTQDVRQFTIDTGRIPIDWHRLVVLGIDGVNTELRKRDYDVYRFARDEHGRWLVVEP